MPFLARIRLSTKALIPPALFLLAMVLATGMAVRSFQDDLQNERRATLRAVNKSVLATLSYFAAAEQAGRLSHAEAVAGAKDAVGRLRYGTDDYVTIFSGEGAILVHPNAGLLNKTNADLPPAVGKMVRDQVEGVRTAPDLFYDLLFPRAAGGQPVPKLNYIVKFAPWNWVVSTGVYVDDLQAAVWSYATKLGLISLAAALAAAAISWVLISEFAGSLRRVVGSMELIAQGDTDALVPEGARRDEAGTVSRALDTIRRGLADAKVMRARADAAQTAASELETRSHAERARAADVQGIVVASLATGLEKLAEGDLTFRIEEAFAAEYEKLRSDFNATIAQLQTTMRTVIQTTGGIHSGTGEIASAADDLSRRTEQQAASLEETAAALDEITATVRKTAEGANHARSVVAKTKEHAEHSGQVVESAVTAMSAIETSSSEIGQIIGVIDEIAFQTNLLALNAGVEAARAGEAGRGFAVVAQEVRALAQRSAEAAKEIKALISASGTQVASGVALVGETGRSLAQIGAQVAEINRIVAEIAASAAEQSTGLAEVNTAVNQMDQVTQQNAAMVEQTTAASHSLAGEADQLAQLVGRFRVESEAARPLRPTATRARPAASSMPARPATRGNLALKSQPQADSWEEF